MRRIDTAKRLIKSSPRRVYLAFSTPGALEQWLPPEGMTGEMVEFQFRDGGHYRMRLRYTQPQHMPGKTSADTDETYVKIARLIQDEKIVQAITFESDDPQFSGEMWMTWNLIPSGQGTLVEVRAENVPTGIRAADHEAGLASTLNNLAAFVENPTDTNPQSPS